MGWKKERFISIVLITIFGIVYFALNISIVVELTVLAVHYADDTPRINGSTERDYAQLLTPLVCGVIFCVCAISCTCYAHNIAKEMLLFHFDGLNEQDFIQMN